MSAGWGVSVLQEWFCCDNLRIGVCVLKVVFAWFGEAQALSHTMTFFQILLSFFLLSTRARRGGGGNRVRKSKNFPDSKIFHAKTFRIKRVNCNTFAFVTKVRKTGECHVFFPNVHKVGLDGVWIIRWLSGLSGMFLYHTDIFWIVQTVFRLSEQSLGFPDSF